MGKMQMATVNRLLATIELLWEIPFSILSFGFSRILRSLMQSLIGVYMRAKGQQAPEWELVSAEFLASPIRLLWAMTRARWNLHAMVAIASPLQVKESIRLNLQAANRSAQSWTIVVYTLPEYKTLTSISSLQVADSEEWRSLSLQPGTYLLGLRYYHWSDPVEFPAVLVDDQLTVDAKTVAAPATINQFYRELIQRQNLLHQWLNYYVFNLLRYRRWLPKTFVERVFLPVPNPETKFYYGALRPGESLQLEIDPVLLRSHSIYFSLYDRTCFPLDWYPITDSQHQTTPADQKSIYLVRVHQQFSNTAPVSDDQLQFTIAT